MRLADIRILHSSARTTGAIHPDVTTYPLSQAMTAYAAMREGRLDGRAVIVPAG